MYNPINQFCFRLKWPIFSGITGFYYRNFAVEIAKFVFDIVHGVFTFIFEALGFDTLQTGTSCLVIFLAIFMCVGCFLLVIGIQ